jgi:hypothetical protein
MRQVLRKERKRKLDGKESEFTIHGRRVPPEKMRRFTKRKDVSEANVLEEQIRESV